MRDCHENTGKFREKITQKSWVTLRKSAPHEWHIQTGHYNRLNWHILTDDTKTAIVLSSSKYLAGNVFQPDRVWTGIVYGQIFSRFTHTQIFLFEVLLNQTEIIIVFTIFRLIWNQTVVRLVLNQSENGKWNMISFWFVKISKRFLCVHWRNFCKKTISLN